MLSTDLSPKREHGRVRSGYHSVLRVIRTGRGTIKWFRSFQPGRHVSSRWCVFSMACHIFDHVIGRAWIDEVSGDRSARSRRRPLVLYNVIASLFCLNVLKELKQELVNSGIYYVANHLCFPHCVTAINKLSVSPEHRTLFISVRCASDLRQV